VSSDGSGTYSPASGIAPTFIIGPKGVFAGRKGTAEACLPGAMASRITEGLESVVAHLLRAGGAYPGGLRGRFAGSERWNRFGPLRMG